MWTTRVGGAAASQDEGSLRFGLDHVFVQVVDSGAQILALLDLEGASLHFAGDIPTDVEGFFDEGLRRLVLAGAHLVDPVQLVESVGCAFEARGAPHSFMLVHVGLRVVLGRVLRGVVEVGLEDVFLGAGAVEGGLVPAADRRIQIEPVLLRGYRMLSLLTRILHADSLLEGFLVLLPLMGDLVGSRARLRLLLLAHEPRAPAAKDGGVLRFLRRRVLWPVFFGVGANGRHFFLLVVLEYLAVLFALGELERLALFLGKRVVARSE